MIPLTESLIVVIHHRDAHSSEQPGRITRSSKDLDLYTSSFRVSSYFANLLYFLLASFDTFRYLRGLNIWLWGRSGADGEKKGYKRASLCMYELTISSCLKAHLGFLVFEVKCYFWETMQLLCTSNWKHQLQHRYTFMPERTIAKMWIKE